jgi:hypothetical protein
MKSTEATVFDRKSGGAEGPAVRLSLSQLPTGTCSPFLLRSGAPNHLDEVVQPQLAGKGFLDLGGG